MWIELITQADQERVRCCEYVLELARTGQAEIWTSTFTLAEVFKRKCDNENVSLPEHKDSNFEDFIEQPYIKKVAVDVNVGTVARRLLRKHPSLRKPQDAIHVASCLLNNVDELHTFDETDLIKFHGMLPRADNIKLTIARPPEPPSDPQKVLEYE